MKKAKKVLTLLLCAALLVGATITGTLAFLTQTTETVTNTFTVGKVQLGEDSDGDGIVEGGLDEAKVDVYGRRLKSDDTVFDEENDDEKDLAKRVTVNTYKLIPGHTYVKDPTIHVAKGSEPCYLFVKVTNPITGIEATGDTTIAKQMENNGWAPLAGVTDTYYKTTTVSTTEDAGEDVDVFGSFTLDDNADVSTYAGQTITVVAYAIQADGFTTAADAWSAAPSTWGVTTP
ncbi:MAG: SipW-dependent-type signal peptide-containing protein [Lachnospiraceae bacterium]|nr:SipW-dependent-type signal peptide-containing protein [Lachnospiraceae bacterium]